MSIIYKYKLKREPGKQILPLPVDFRILTIRVQNETPCLWAIVDEEEDNQQLVNIYFFETGSILKASVNPPNQLHYMGTLQFDNGEYVLHAFVEGVAEIR